MEYTCRKNKNSRTSLRILGFFFILIGICSLIYAIVSRSRIIIIIFLLSVFVLGYGFYLVKMTFRRQAYDMTYKFNSDNIQIIYNKGEESISYSDVLEVKVIEPSPDIDIKILQIKVKGNQYVLHFSNNGFLCQQIYLFVDSRIEKNNEGVENTEEK